MVPLSVVLNNNYTKRNNYLGQVSTKLQRPIVGLLTKLLTSN